MAEIRLSVAIMAHPKRRALVAALEEQLQPWNVAVIWDRDNDVWDTRVRASLAYSSNATHHLVLQDDAIPAPSLLDGLPRVLQSAQEAPVSLYRGGSPSHRLEELRAYAARQAGVPWVQGPGPRWGVAIVLPTSIIPEAMEHGTANPVFRQDDLRLTRFFQAKKIKCWYTMPSLVDHRFEEISIIRQHARPRKAKWFIDSPIESYEWHRPPLEDPECGYFSVDRGRFTQHHCAFCNYTTTNAKLVRQHCAYRHRIPLPASYA